MRLKVSANSTLFENFTHLILSNPQLLFLFRVYYGPEQWVQLHEMASMERIQATDELLCHWCSPDQ
jgi:ABC-type arginine/histidine transport system permease subunit